MSPARQLLTGVLYVCASALYAQTLAITDVNVVDVVNGRIRSSQTVLIRNGMIIAVGRSGSVEVPPMATRIAAMSRFLIPGLWDMHVHLRSDENRQDRALVKENETLLGLFVPNGVIGIRDMGGDLGEHVIRWRDEIREGKRTGPHILTCGSKIDETAGRQWAGTLSVKTPEQGKSAVQSVKHSGANFCEGASCISKRAFRNHRRSEAAWVENHRTSTPEHVAASLCPQWIRRHGTRDVPSRGKKKMFNGLLSSVPAEKAHPGLLMALKLPPAF